MDEGERMFLFMAILQTEMHRQDVRRRASFTLAQI
jgi:hypothetical protein